MTIHATKT